MQDISRLWRNRAEFGPRSAELEDLRVHAEQAKVVLQMYKWRAAGWSGQRIARQLNADGVPSPGAGWNRKDTGPNRKNTAKVWRPSAIVGDPARGVGILNNPLYKGQVVWGRSKWTRSATDSNDRRVETVDATEWVVTKDESLRIVPDDLWDKVRAVQTATNPRREAVGKGIAKKASGHGSKYWLGTLLVCGECGSNYIGYGRRDYVCPAHTAGHCGNDLRFRRDDAHIAVFDLLREQVPSESAIARGKKYNKAVLKEREQQEHAAAKDAESGVDVSRLDKEAAELRAMGLRPAALAAGLAEIEKERA